MTGRCPTLARGLLITGFILLSQAAARADDFGMIVRNVEKHYGARQKKIPMLGLAGFAVRLIHPAGVKNFKLAVFEEQDFAPGERDRAFEKTVSASINSKWKPMMQARDRSSGNRTYVYTHQAGKDFEMLTVTISKRQAIVAQAKVDPVAVSKFINKPELLGISLAGGRSSGILDSSILGSTSSSSGDFGGFVGVDWRSSTEELKAAGIDVDPVITVPKSEPKLTRRSDTASEFNPVPEIGPSSSESKLEADAIHLEARLINLNVKAVDRSGTSISTLQKSDFRIFEDGVEQQIFYFEPVNAPMNIVLLLDLSGSTRDSRRSMIETAQKFVDALGSGDRAAIAAFTRRYYILSTFTSDKRRLKESLDKVKKIEGGTAFYDGMWQTLDLLGTLKESRKAIVVLTDGVDNSLLDGDYEPTRHSFEELLSRVSEDEVTIYPIYFNPEEAKITETLKDPTLTEGRRERLERRLSTNLLAHHQLDQLGQESAGMVFLARDESELGDVYGRVAAELRLMYTLAYAPKNTAHDGKFRKISVSVNRDGTVVRTRRGYISK